MIRPYVTFLLLSLMLTLCNGVTAFANDSQGNSPNGKLSGQILSSGKKPLSNARLFIYSKAMGPPSSDRYARVPDDIKYLDMAGKFLLELEPGAYYLSAINVNESAPMGPPAEGEPVYFKMDKTGAIEPFSVIAGKETNVGIISTSSPFKRAIAGIEKGATLVEGIITDETGAPVEGAVILADDAPGIQKKALYASEKTAKNGKFILRVNEGGEYFLRVRSVYHGGMPADGDIINANDPKEQIAVSLKTGERLSGIQIKVKRQPQKGPLFRGVPLDQ